MIVVIAALALLIGSPVTVPPTQEAEPATKPATGLVERFIAWQRPALGAEIVGVLLPVQPKWAPALTASSGPRPLQGPDSFPVLGPGSWLLYAEGAEPRLPHIEPAAFKPFGDAALIRAQARPWSQYPDPRFVVTGFEVLDGSKEYPIRVAKALDEARSRFDEHIAEHQPAVSKTLGEGLPTAPIRDVGPQLHESKRKPPLPGEEPAFGPIEDRVDEGVFPAWFAKENELRVLFVRRVTRAQTRARWYPDDRPCRRGAPCMPPRPYWSTQEKGLSMLIGYRVVFDRKGEIVSEEHFGPTPEPR